METPSSAAEGVVAPGWFDSALHWIALWFEAAGVGVIVLGAVFAVALVGTAIGLVTWTIAASTRRQDLGRRRWVTRFLDRIEAAGAARGRSRPAAQSAPAYIREIARSVLPDGRLGQVADLVEREVFGAIPAGEKDRDAAEQILEDASARWPPG